MERFCGEISFQHKPRFKGNSDVKIVETFVPYGLPFQECLASSVLPHREQLMRLTRMKLATCTHSQGSIISKFPLP